MLMLLYAFVAFFSMTYSINEASLLSRYVLQGVVFGEGFSSGFAIHDCIGLGVLLKSMVLV